MPNGTPCDPFAAKVGTTDHGTAVLGELVGDANGFGVTGLAPGATLRTVNAASLGGQRHVRVEPRRRHQRRRRPHLAR